MENAGVTEENARDGVRWRQWHLLKRAAERRRMHLCRAPAATLCVIFTVFKSGLPGGGHLVERCSSFARLHTPNQCSSKETSTCEQPLQYIYKTLEHAAGITTAHICDINACFALPQSGKQLGLNKYKRKFMSETLLGIQNGERKRKKRVGSLHLYALYQHFRYMNT